MTTSGEAAQTWEPLPRETSSKRSIFGNFRDAPPVVPDEAGDARPTAAAGRTADAANVSPTTALARAFLHSMLARAFADPSTEGWLWLNHSETKAGFWAAVKELRDSALEGAALALAGAWTPDAFEAFHDDYLAAFGHAARGTCPMNEIEFGDLRADPLFQPHRLADLAAFYRAFGLDMTPDATERQDHICVELEFMSVLAAKEAYALDQRLGGDAVEVCRDTERKFLREHLGRWVPAFGRRLLATAGPGALGALGDFVRAFVECECVRFGVRPGSEDLMLRPVDEEGERLCENCAIQQLPPGALRGSAIT